MAKETQTNPLSSTARRHLLDGARFLKKNDFAHAERSATFALALAPDRPQPIEFFGSVLRLKGAPAAAIDLLRDGVTRHGEDFGIRRELANALAAVDDLDGAIEHFNAALALRSDGEVWFELGSVHDRNGQGNEALHAARNALALLPDHQPSRFLLASALTSTGKIDAAAAEYRALTKHPAQAAKAWFGLMDLKTIRLSPEEITLLQKLESISTASDADRIFIGFVLGRAFEMAERYEDALTALAKANSLVRRGLVWSASAHTQLVEQIARAFDVAKDSPSASIDDACPVIFVLGMPRSGSTLVEQILSAHPSVTGAGELQHVDAVIAAESRRRGKPFGDWAASATDDEWRRLGSEYLLRTRRFQRGGPFTDKLPSNWRYVGALRRMLPAARFVFTERDLLENCWSCFKQMFSPGRMAYSSDWTELVHYAMDCQSLWGVWQERYPDFCRKQSYEALQLEPEEQTRELLAFCGLPFDESCLNFHTTARNVRTASAAQVRQPLRRDTAQAARYGPVLSSFRRILAAVRQART